MKRRIFNQLIAALILGHLAISFVFVANPDFLSTQVVAKLYKWYLIPGPFFYDKVIVHNDHVLVSWKMNDQWSAPINPASKNFTHFLSTGNPYLMYRTRLESSFLIGYMASLESEADSKSKKRLDLLKRYYVDHYVPREVDSTRLTLIRKVTGNFTSQIDTIYKVTF